MSGCEALEENNKGNKYSNINIYATKKSKILIHLEKHYISQKVKEYEYKVFDDLDSVAKEYSSIPDEIISQAMDTLNESSIEYLDI